MVSSADVALLMKVAELAQRLGLRPIDADADLVFVDSDKDPEGSGYHGLYFGSIPADPHNAAKFRQMEELLGVNHDGLVKAEHFHELEDIVDRALSLAPRARVR
jgi:hypothetical protein